MNNIGFVVVDTITGAKLETEDHFAITENGRLLQSDDAEVNEKTKYSTELFPGGKPVALPSITIDGVEYYEGQVIKSYYQHPSDLEWPRCVVKFGSYFDSDSESNTLHFGWHCMSVEGFEKGISYAFYFKSSSSRIL